MGLLQVLEHHSERNLWGWKMVRETFIFMSMTEKGLGTIGQARFTRE